MNKHNFVTYEFPDSKCLVVCGDIHGDFNMLVNKVCAQYQLKDAVVIVAGDCGFGFDPAYFDGKTIAYKRLMAIPDYSVVKANGHTALCVGGAISIDRQYRISAWNRNVMNQLHFGHSMNDKDPLAPNYYWKDEMSVFNEDLLSQILAEHPVDTVITHTAPSFCEMKSKAGISSWIKYDPDLVSDLDHERSIMDEIYSKVKSSSVTHWCYGHFHQSWHADIDGILFKMLDIMELYEVR